MKSKHPHMRFAIGLFLAIFFAQYANESKSVGAGDNVSAHPKATSNDFSDTSSVLRRNDDIEFMEVIEKLELFTGSNHSILDSGTGCSTVSDRAAIGFQQDLPGKLRLPDGGTIMWGWQHNQAQFESVVVFDRNGALRMVGLMDNIPRIYSKSSNTVITNLVDYEADRERALVAPPAVHLYAANQEDINTFYPLIAQWLKAAMMGFNSRCNDPSQSASCRLTEEIQIPIYFHTRDCPYRDGSHPQCSLQQPASTSGTAPSIDDFTQ